MSLPTTSYSFQLHSKSVNQASLKTPCWKKFWQCEINIHVHVSMCLHNLYVLYETWVCVSNVFFVNKNPITNDKTKRHSKRDSEDLIDRYQQLTFSIFSSEYVLCKQFSAEQAMWWMKQISFVLQIWLAWQPIIPFLYYWHIYQVNRKCVTERYKSQLKLSQLHMQKVFITYQNKYHQRNWSLAELIIKWTAVFLHELGFCFFP